MRRYFPSNDHPNLRCTSTKITVTDKLRLSETTRRSSILFRGWLFPSILGHSENPLFRLYLVSNRSASIQRHTEYHGADSLRENKVFSSISRARSAARDDKRVIESTARPRQRRQSFTQVKVAGGSPAACRAHLIRRD